MEKPNLSPIQNKPKPSQIRRVFVLLSLSFLVLVFVTLSLFVTGQAQRILSVLVQPTKTPARSIDLPTQTDLPISLPTLTATPSPHDFATQPVSSTLYLAPSSTQPTIENSVLQSLDEGTLILSFYEGLHAHLFAYHPYRSVFTRLTTGNSDDITPSVSPDGNQIAFASNRGGFWDLYILDLTTGEILQLTNTAEYDASPSWSPDGRWLVYESYVSDQAGSANLELLIREVIPTTPEQTPLRLTNRPAADFSPAWSPNGRQIVFVSINEGEKNIWLADLNSMENRLQLINGGSAYPAAHPSWSPNGETVLWSSIVDGIGSLYTWQPAKPELAPQYIGAGDWATWDATGNVVLTLIRTPNQSYLSGFDIRDNQLAIIPIRLGGKLTGLCWSSKQLTSPLPSSISEAARVTLTPDWQVAIAPQAEKPILRREVVPLNGITAPFPYIHDLVDEALQALRESVMDQIAWDYLSTLENAYVPLTSPLSPGMLDDWLYTGRAFSASTAPSHAGWLLVVREVFGSACYWRVFLRTRYQDGSQGMPLQDLPWDFSMRLNSNPRNYEQGGGNPRLPPGGYWLDFTHLASSYGWERLPALSSWPVAPPSARYNEFLYRDGLDWYAAMLEIYPVEAVVTVTPPPPPTATPTRTLVPSLTATPTQTPTAGLITTNITPLASTTVSNPSGSQVTPSP